MNAEQRRIQCWDIDAGYAAAHEEYRVNELMSGGFQEIRVFGSMYAEALSKRLNDTAYLPAETLKSPPVHLPNLCVVFTGIFMSIRKVLYKHFQSEFAPCFCSMLKQGVETFGPKNGINESYLWHRDNGPSSHLKLIIYLNDDHDGATAVMSRDDSRKFIDAGYLEQERLFHLDEFAEEHGISYTPSRVQPKAGSGLIFEPTNVLHKGIYPTFGERRVFQIGIIPWGKPWENFYEEHWAKGYSNSNGFPRYEGAKIA